MEVTDGLLPKIQDLGMSNKYADGHLLLRPELFYYNQGLTVKHLKTSVDKFEKAKMLFTLSSKMISDQYIAQLFSEDVVAKLKPQVISIYGINLPPELMHWRDSVGIIVKHSIYDSTFPAEQIAILQILAQSEDSSYTENPVQLGEEIMNNDTKPAVKGSIDKTPKYSLLERLKTVAKSRGSLNRTDLDKLNRLTIDVSSVDRIASSTQSSRAASASATPLAPRASASKTMSFNVATLDESFQKLNSCTSLIRTDSESVIESVAVPFKSKHNNRLSTNNAMLGDSKNTVIPSADETATNQSELHFNVRVKEDCSWHSDMETFAEPRTDISLSDDDYENLLNEILAEYGYELSNESSDDSKRVKKTHRHYNYDTLGSDENSVSYRKCIENFRKRLSRPNVLDSCAQMSKLLRQSKVVLGHDARIHENATFDSNYEVVRSRFKEHMIIDVPIPVALASTPPISASYNGPITYKSFVLNKHVDGIIVANALDGSAMLYIRPAQDYHLVKAKKAFDKVYLQDVFVKRNYITTFQNLKQSRHNHKTSSSGFKSLETQTPNTPPIVAHNYSVNLMQFPSTLNACVTGLQAKPNSRNETRCSANTTLGSSLSSLTHEGAMDKSSLKLVEQQPEEEQQLKDDNIFSLSPTQNTEQQNVPPIEVLVISKPPSGLTVSMLDPVTLPSISNTNLSPPINNPVETHQKSIHVNVSDTIITHSIISSNIRAVDTGKVVHRHSILLKDSAQNKSAYMGQDFTNNFLNSKIYELNTNSLFKKAKSQVGDIYDQVPSGVAYLQKHYLDSTKAITNPQCTSLNFFEEKAKLQYEQFVRKKAETKALDKWKLTSSYGHNLIPFGGSTMKHSAVYVDIRDVIQAREAIKAKFSGSVTAEIQPNSLTGTMAKSIHRSSTTFSRKDNVISVCGSRVSAHTHMDWWLKTHSK